MAREHPIEKYRNIGIMAHIDAGKTTTTERILYYTGKSYKIGEVHDGAATMDWIGAGAGARHHHHVGRDDDLLEGPPGQHHRHAGPRRLHHRGGALAARARRRGRGVRRASRAWSRSRKRSGAKADKYKVPRMCFVNKLDRTGANFEMCVEMIKDRLGARPMVLALPVGIESDLQGIVDLVQNKAIIWKSEGLGAEFEVVDVPADMKDAADAARSELIEMAVEQDDDVMEAYLEGEEPDMDTLKRLIRKGTLGHAFVPVLCGSAFKNKGVQPLLDAVVDYMPAPTDVPAIKGVKPGTGGEDEEPVEDKRVSSDEAPFSALAFKIMSDPFVGTLTFARIYSGKLEASSQVLNTVKDKKKRSAACC